MGIIITIIAMQHLVSLLISLVTWKVEKWLETGQVGVDVSEVVCPCYLEWNKMLLALLQ